MKQRIKSITFASTQGGYSYQVGFGSDGTDNSVIDRIVAEDRNVNGDPYEFYIGYNANGDQLFQANVLNACVVVEYFAPQSKK